MKVASIVLLLIVFAHNTFSQNINANDIKNKDYKTIDHLIFNKNPENQNYNKLALISKNEDNVINEEPHNLNNSIIAFIKSQIENEFDIPIKTLKIEPYIIPINNLKDTLIQLVSGTSIFIPNNCFVKSNGDLVTQNIYIVYREMNDPLSIFASGIPMTTTINAKQETLTSAGMFEIKAFSNTDEIQIKDGKKIDIDFVSINDGNNPYFYDFHEFDNTKNEWKDLNLMLSTSELNNNKQDFTDLIKILTIKTKVPYPNSTNFNERFKDLNYFYLKDTNNFKIILKNEDIYESKGDFLNKNYYTKLNEVKNNHNLIHFINIQKQNTNNLNSSLMYQINIKICKTYFPELISFKNFNFYHNEFNNHNDFDNKYINEKIYSDIRIEYQKGDDYCSFILKEQFSHITIMFKLFDDKVTSLKDQRRIRNIFYNKYLNYLKKLDDRRKIFDLGILMLEFGYHYIYIFPSFNKYIFHVATWMKSVDIKRKAELVKTGLFNSNIKFERNNAKSYQLDLFNEQKDSIQFKDIYVFDENANSYFKYNNKNVVFDPKTLVGIIVTSLSGLTYYINKNEISKLNLDDANLNLKMHLPDKKIENINQIIELFIE